jgi:8-oxo-dGTP pyrophosphatase MutT (NUDIX family)
MVLLVSAGILILRNVSSSPEILLLKSTEGCCWGPPKGHLEGSENGFDAAIRETYEETGISFEQIDVIDGFQELISYQSRSRRFKTVVFYLAKVVNSEVKIRLSSEHNDYAWTNLSEALGLVQLESVKKVLCSAFAFYKDVRNQRFSICEAM